MDEAVKRAHFRKYSRRSTVQNMLRHHMGDRIRNLDLSTLETIRGAVVTSELRRHAGEVLWRVRTRGGGWMYLIVMPEFEPEPHRYVPERVLAYAALAFDEAVRQGALGPNGEFPQVMPAMIYNEFSYWRMAPDLSDLIGTGKDLITYRPDRLQEGTVLAPGEEPVPLAREMVPALTELECTLSPEPATKVLEILEEWLWSPSPEVRSKLGFTEWVANLVTRRELPVPFVSA